MTRAYVSCREAWQAPEPRGFRETEEASVTAAARLPLRPQGTEDTSYFLSRSDIAVAPRFKENIN
jgi:hypothetical protein